MTCKILLSVLFLSIVGSNFLYAKDIGGIKGYVTDSTSGEPLPGANVMVQNTSMGASTDIKGTFIISNVPIGKQVLLVKYIGYEDLTYTIKVKKNKLVQVKLRLKPAMLEGEEIVVSVQAQGQMAAINQQLSSRSITNVVSAKKIQEIPDANAAEAVGRLPGVSLIREGGEGNKVVIRGLAPKFNKIEVEGVKMAATGNDDRSSDLSMISPYMLDGIEVTKAALPDKDANVIGGNVNFLLREAPDEPHWDAIAQTGYNGLKKELGDYKFVFSGSKRFLDKNLGLFAQINIEKRNRSSYELGVDYTRNDFATTNVDIQDVLLKDFSRDVNRYGGTIVLDYKLPDGKIKLSSFFSSIDKLIVSRFDNYRALFADRFYSLSQTQNDLFVMTNALKYKQSFSGFLVSSGISLAFSENKMPKNIGFRGYSPDAFGNTSLKYNVSPEEFVSFADNDLSTAYLYDISRSNNYTREADIAATLDIQYKISLSNNIETLFKGGFKYKQLNKRFNKEFRWMPIHWGGGEPAKRIDAILQAYPWMQNTAPLGSTRLPYSLFVDKQYNPNNFLGGNFNIKDMPDKELVNGIANVLKDQLFYNYHESIKDDYYGGENYYAAYLMSEIKIGQSLVFIPGVRFEKNRTNYNGVRGNAQTKLEHIGYVHSDTTTVRNNDFLLPMIHLKYKPLDWFDLRLAYTQTLARPDYNKIVPKWNRTLTTVFWNNPYLKPSLATNYDIYASFYNNTIGLFTIGGFYKNIKNLIFYAGQAAIVNPDEYGLPQTSAGKTISKVINNKYPADLYGMEIDWQTHFWYLPGILQGMVLNVNYTHTFSKVKYPRNIIQTKYLTHAPWIETTNIDTFYTGRLVFQPNNILNITLGMDYKGFSPRISMLYQADIFSLPNNISALRGTTDKYLRWDISVTQKLPINGLEIFGNFNNISSTIERDINTGTGFPRREQHYGMTADIGLRYIF